MPGHLPTTSRVDFDGNVQQFAGSHVSDLQQLMARQLSYCLGS
jgi:hypothetical protein